MTADAAPTPSPSLAAGGPGGLSSRSFMGLLVTQFLGAINDNMFRWLVVPIFLAGLWGSIFSFEGGKVFWKRPRRWPYPVSILIGRPIAEPSDTEHVREAVAQLQRRWQEGSET